MQNTTPSRERDLAVLAATIFMLGLGEELWQAYLPVYLGALGAGGVAVGLFGSSRDLLDSVYQFPGGWIADRIGRRRALLTFTGLATAGYATYALAPSWPFLFAGLFGVMGWKAGAFSTTFAMIGDSLPSDRRAVAFSAQSILVRVPRVIAAPLGGLAIASAGLLSGMRLCFSITVALAFSVLALQHRVLRRDHLDPPPPGSAAPRVPAMPAGLWRLLAADALVRIGEGLAASFIVLFLTQERHLSAGHYGLLYGLQQSVALLFYLPGGRIADRTGRSAIIALTLAFFALFPLCVRFATSPLSLAGAFCIGGLREIGEPARKALIVDLAPLERRASTIGLYYAIRNLLVVPAGLAGGLLWERAHHLPLEAGFVVSVVGVAVFLMLPGPEAIRPGLQTFRS